MLFSPPLLMLSFRCNIPDSRVENTPVPAVPVPYFTKIPVIMQCSFLRLFPFRIHSPKGALQQCGTRIRASKARQQKNRTEGIKNKRKVQRPHEKRNKAWNARECQICWIFAGWVHRRSPEPLLNKGKLRAYPMEHMRFELTTSTMRTPFQVFSVIC